MRNHVEQFFSGVGVGDHSAYGNAEINVFSSGAVAIGAAAVFPFFCVKTARVPEVDQRIDVAVRSHPHAAAAATVTAVGPALRDELFTTKRCAAIAAVAGGDVDSRFIDKFHVAFRWVRK